VRQALQIPGANVLYLGSCPCRGRGLGITAPTCLGRPQRTYWANGQGGTATFFRTATPVSGMNLPNLDDQKAAQRKLSYAQRRAIEDDQAEAAALAVAAKLGDIVAVGEETVVSAYWPLRGELDTRPALMALIKRGAAGALPRTVGAGSPLDFHDWKPDDPLIKGQFKVMEPDPASPKVTPSILLVPLLAFDRQCRRLGYGQGHYDRTLQGLKSQNPATLAIGLAFAAQEIEHVPTDQFDQTLDMILTEKAVYSSS